MRHSAEGETPSDQVPENMPANMPAEIVRKVAEALHARCRPDQHWTACELAWHHQNCAELALAVAEPLIREQIAQEIEASRATNTFRTTVLERAAKIARGGQ